MLSSVDGRELAARRMASSRLTWSAVAVLCFLIGVLLLAVGLRGFANDDPFITYRYARNLAQGNGLVYNVGLDVLSTTTLLYTLILTLAYSLGLDLPTFSNSLSALSLGLAAFLLYRMAAAQSESMAGLVAGLSTLFFPLILVTFGAETAFHILLIVASFFFYSQEHLTVAATTAGLATITRGDGVLVAVALAGHYILTRRRFPLRSFLVYCAVVAPWYIYSWVHFGSPFPVTLQAKLHQSNMAVTVGFFPGIAHWAKGYARQINYWLYLPLMLLGAIGVMRKRRWAVPMLLWAVLYSIGYSLLNVPRYHWYYSPLIPPLMLLVGLGVSGLVKWAISLPRLQIVAGLILAGLLIWPSLRATQRLIQRSPDGRAQIYTEVGNWLNQHTPSEATIGTLEVGILGYYSERSIIDFAGLIQPDITEHVESGYENAATWAIHAYRPDYLVIHPGWFPAMVATPWFSERYRTVEQFENERYNANPLVVYAATQRQE